MRPSHRRVAEVAFALTLMSACSGGDQNAGEEAKPAESSVLTTVTAEPTTTPLPPERAMSEECHAWEMVRADGVIETADTGREPQRTELLDALSLFRDSQMPGSEELVMGGGDLESLDYFFDPIIEYVAFGTDPDAVNDAEYAGDRDAFLIAIGYFDQYCGGGID